jgi:MraZ protein
MLHGATVYTVDERHRILLPKNLAAELSYDIMVTLGPERNVLLYKYDVWYERCLKAAGRGMDETSLIWERLFIAMAHRIELDRQNRFVLPESLRKFTGIEKGTEIVVMGARNRVEVWNKQAWDSYLESIAAERVYSVMAEVERNLPSGHVDSS